MFLGFRPTEAKYTSLEQSPSTPLKLSSRFRGYGTTLRDNWREAIIVCLSILCAGLILDLILSPLDTAIPEPVPEYKITSTDRRWVQFQWTTGVYSSEDPHDADKVNKAWDEIIPAYGFVAVDHAWAADHHLPIPPNPLPNNNPPNSPRNPIRSPTACPAATLLALL